MTLVGVGHALADAFAFVDQDVPKILGLHPGTFSQVPDYRMKAMLAIMRQKNLMAGGSAANVVKLAARLGLDAYFIGQCGHDEAAQVFESELLGAGVKTSLTRNDSPTGMCVTLLSSEGRTSATLRSASGGLMPGMVSDALLTASDVVVAEGYLLDEPEFLRDLLDRCRRVGKPVAFDVGQGMVDGRSDVLLAHIERGAIGYLFLREADAATLTSREAEAALDLLAKSACTVVQRQTETLARRGAETCAVPRPETEAVDRTGSDDGFEAGFLWALSQSWSLEAACCAGNLVAACIERQPGTRVEETLWRELLSALAALKHDAPR